jgi:hypothetical protein
MKKNNEQTLKDVLGELMKTYRLRQGNNEWAIKEAWPRLFGDMINRHTTQLRLSKRKLYVKVDSAPLKQELSMGREKIRRILNEELGDDFLEEIILL